MAGKDNPKQLIVEGHDDLHSVCGLMRAHIGWPAPGPKSADESPVFITAGGGAEKILEKGYILAKLKEPTIQILGIMLDADADPQGRYQSIRNQCVDVFPKLPKTITDSGVISANDDPKRIGIWIMPDNLVAGSVELFLQYLVPNDSENTWKHAVSSVETARSMGAGCRDQHIPKANLYTWLAWHDPPGQSPGIALTKKILDPHSASAKPFVEWFKKLYEL